MIRLTHQSLLALFIGLVALVQPACAADLPEAEQLTRQAAPHFIAGRFREALGLLEKAQALRLVTLSPEQAEGIEGARLIAVVRERMGEPEQALREFERLLPIATRVLGDRHVTAMLLVGNIASTLVNLGRYAEALPLTEKAYRQLLEVLGDRDPKTLGAQSNYGSNLSQVGRYTEALTLLDANVALRTVTLGPAHPQTLSGMSVLAMVATSAGQDQKALNVANQCLAQATQLADTHPEKLQCLLQRAQALAKLTRPAESTTAFRAAYAAAERQYGPNHWLTLSAQSGLANALGRSGDFAGELQLWAKVYETSRAARGAENSTTLSYASNYAAALRNSGRSEDAVKLARETWETAKRALGPDHQNTRAFQGSYAVELHESGHTREALPIMQDRLAAAKLRLGESHQETLTTMNSIANFQTRLGQDREALAGYEALYEAARRALGINHEQTLQAQRNIAYMYSRLGRYREAMELNRQVLRARVQIFGEESIQAVDVMSLLAGDLQRIGRNEEALDLARRAYEIRVKQLGGDHIGITVQSELFAVVLVKSGKLDEALAPALKTVEIRRAHLGGDHPQTLDALTSLGLVYTRLGRNADAIKIYEQVLEAQVRIFGEAHLSTLTSLNNLVLAYGLDRKGDAARTAKRGVDVAEKLRVEQMLSTENRQAFLAKWSDLYRNYALLTAITGKGEESFQASELLKARTLMESSLLRDAMIELPAEATAGLNRLGEEIAALNERLAVIGRQPSLRAMVESDKNRKVSELEAGRQALFTRYPNYANSVRPALISARDLRQQLPADTALVSYVLLDDQVLIYAMTREDGVVYKTDIIPGFTQSVRALRELLSRKAMGAAQRGIPVWKLENGSFVASATRPAQASAEINETGAIADFLGGKLLGPISASIVGKKSWIIAPDGELALIPLEVLRFRGESVLAQHDVSVVPSASLYPLLAKREREYSTIADRKMLLAIGGADYSTHESTLKGVSPRPTYTIEEIAKLIKLRTGSENDETARGFGLMGVRWLQLPGSEREVDAVARLFSSSSVTVFKRHDATETKLRDLNDAGELQKYRYLHFAAHGYLSTEEPALSSLVLGATAGADGYVTAADWARYRLRSDLVVLSACDTGIGRLVRGEGIVGLPYALFAAGARNTLMTLWPVHDAATAEFMTRFYEFIRDGMPQAAALAETKRAFLKHPRYSGEEFWAPFVLYGS